MATAHHMYGLDAKIHHLFVFKDDENKSFEKVRNVLKKLVFFIIDIMFNFKI